MHAYNLDSITEAQEDYSNRTKCLQNVKIYELAYHLNPRAGEWVLQERRQTVDDEWTFFSAPLTSSLSWKRKLGARF